MCVCIVVTIKEFGYIQSYMAAHEQCLDGLSKCMIFSTNCPPQRARYWFASAMPLKTKK